MSREIPIYRYVIALTTVECEGQTTYKLRVRWKRSPTHWRTYRKTWKYKVLENALRRIQTLVDKYGKPRTLDIMGYLAQYEGASGFKRPGGAPMKAPDMADWSEIEDLLPHFRSYGISVRWSSCYEDTLVASTHGEAIYVTWEQIAYLAEHGVRMSVMGFALENLTKYKGGDHNV